MSKYLDATPFTPPFLFIILADALRRKPELHPELLVWFPNVLFLILGAWLFLRLSRQ